ncbi:MAG: cyclic nucleotide-binding domain-containing protein [Deltaproteobacteria bacterium]|nr:cyclic nucleotide-binding domain-containing protein [Deltaproteobacteria bacterium]
MITREELASAPFFGALDEQEQALLAGVARRGSAAAGEAIFKAGERSRTLYVVIDGLVSLRQKARVGKAETTMAAGRPGEVIGVSAMLEGEGVHSVSGVCLEATEFIELDVPDLMKALEAEPAVGLRILRRLTLLLAERLAAARAQLGSQTREGLISHG